MKRFNIIIWKWQEKVLDKNYDFETYDDASLYSLGLYDGMREIGHEVTGRKVEEIGMPRQDMVVGDELAQAQTEICENLYNESISKVYDYGNKANMPYTDCKPCEASTPTIISKDSDKCALCGSEKQKQENYK